MTDLDLRTPLTLLPLVALAWILVEAVRLQRQRRHWCARIVDGEQLLLSEDFGPALVGVIRPRIVLPAETLALPPAQRTLVLLHEIEHRRAHDSRLAFAGALLVAATPWNPLAWWMYRRLRLAIEFDCDQRVLARTASAREYGNVLLQVASSGSHAPFVTALLERRSWLERRIRRLGTQVVRRSRRHVGALVSAAGASLALSAVIPVPLVAPFDVSARRLEQPPRINGSVQPTSTEYRRWFGVRATSANRETRVASAWRLYQFGPAIVTATADPTRPVAERADVVLTVQSLSVPHQDAGMAQVLDARPLQMGQFVLRGEMRTERLGAAAIARIVLFDRCNRVQRVHLSHSAVGNSGWTPFQMVFFVPMGTDHYGVDFRMQGNGALHIRRMEFESLQSPAPLAPLPEIQTPGVACQTTNDRIGGHPESMIPQDLRFTDLTLTLPQIAPRR